MRESWEHARSILEGGHGMLSGIVREEYTILPQIRAFLLPAVVFSLRIIDRHA